MARSREVKSTNNVVTVRVCGLEVIPRALPASGAVYTITVLHASAADGGRS